MALTADGSGTTFSAAGGTSGSVSVTTTLSNDVIVVVVVTVSSTGGGTAPSVSSIPNVSGLTAFTSRGSPFPMLSRMVNTYEFHFEEWWAVAATAGTYSITVNFGATAGGFVLDALSINGANTSSPFDADAPVKASNLTSTSSQIQVAGYSTAAANTMIISAALTIGTLSGGPAPGTNYTTFIFTTGGTLSGTGGGTGLGVDTEYRVVSSAQTSLTVPWGGPYFSGNWMAFADAIVVSSFPSAVSISAGTPVFGTPALGIFSALVLGNNVLDFGLNRLHTNANQIFICSSVPTTYVQATTSFALGSASVAAGTLFGTMSNGSPAGRIVNSSVITAGAVTAAGTPVCWAVIDSVNSDLMASGPASGFSAVTSGQTWQLGSFDVHMSNT